CTSSGSNSWTFYGTNNVQEIHYTKGSGDLMVYDDHSLYSGYYYSLPYMSSTALATVTFEEGITEIPKDLLHGCSNVTDLLIPATVTKIGTSAIENTVTIYGERDSAANIYADANKNTFVALYEPVITVKESTMNAGTSQQLTAKIPTGIHSFETLPSWYIKESSSEKTAIDQTGLLSLDAEETGPVTVGAEFKGHHSTAVIQVIPNRNLKDCEITLEKTKYLYDGTAKEPAVTVTYDGTELTARTDYLVTYDNNTEVGEASVSIIPAPGSAYVGTQTVTFMIFDESTSEALQILNAEIKTCEQIALSDVAYTPKSFAAFTAALDAAKAVAANEDATDEDYQAAYEALLAAKEGLVLKSDCTHDWDEGTVEKEPTCTEDGSVTYTCGECGETKTETIPATGHDWPAEYTVEQAPTCTEDGIAKYTCSKCGETKTETIPAAGHTWPTEYTVDVEPTCTESGLQSIRCEICGEVREGTEMTIDPLGHDWDEGVVDQEPTETVDGVMVYTCRRCGETETVVIEATGHVWDTEFTVDQKPTCTEDGIQSIHCSICGTVKEGSEEVIPALGHDYVTIVTPATNEENGYTEKRCSRCGDIKSGESIPRIDAYELSADVLTYTGKELKPEVMVTDVGDKEISDEFYDLEYTDNVLPGTASVTIRFHGWYAGEETLEYTILPKGTSITKLTKASKAFTVKWKKQAGGTSGYQIQYCLKKTFKSGAKTVTISNPKTVSKKIAKLKAKKQYFVRIRTFYKASDGKYYSAWSKVKNVKTK
ncbi:MAG: fibronectin type III domain-containing protein, partial [Eubacterium sp.]|nr:fibronectin type III domain-containing protein [Eubacterium sp.]